MDTDEELQRKARILWNADYSPLDVMITSNCSIEVTQKEWQFPKKCWFTRKHEFYTHVLFNHIGHTKPIHRCKHCEFDKDMTKEEFEKWRKENPEP